MIGPNGLTPYYRVCNALGLDTENMLPLDVYTVAFRITQDSEFRIVRRGFRHTISAIKSLSVSDREALVARTRRL